MFKYGVLAYDVLQFPEHPSAQTDLNLSILVAQPEY